MKDLIKRWWFWVGIVLMIVIVSFTAIVLIGLNMINPDAGLTNFARELQEYDDNITVYQSAGKNKIAIDCYTQTINDGTEKANDIGKIVIKHLDYLTIYDDIIFNFQTEEGEKEIFSFNIATKQMEEETSETWILQDSIAYKNQEEKIKEMQDKQNSLNSEISKLEEKKDSLNKEIEKLNGDAIRLKGEPKTYPAGHLTAGTDVPTGKYKIYGGSSNFVVYSSTGKLEVNIILGGRLGTSEYIYTFKTGDRIEANSSFKLVAVE